MTSKRTPETTRLSAAALRGLMELHGVPARVPCWTCEREADFLIETTTRDLREGGEVRTSVALCEACAGFVRGLAEPLVRRVENAK